MLSECKDIFVKLTDLKVHLEATHLIKDSDELNIDLELQSNVFEQRFECSICKERFELKAKMKMHFDSIHGEVKFHCDLCTKTFSYQNTLKSHKRHVHKEKKGFYICNICGKDYILKGFYDEHIRVAHNTSP